MKQIMVLIVLLASACSVSQTAADSHALSNGPSTDVAPARVETIGVEGVIAGVAERYSGLKSYKCVGTTEYRAEFDGAEIIAEETDFKIDYTAPRHASIEWKEKENNKLFRIADEKSWLETEGFNPRSFSNARDGLMVVTLSENGASRFLLDVFIFHAELGMNERFFVGLENPKLLAERDIDGKACYVLTGNFRGVEGGQTYWIEKETFLIRRIERKIIVRRETQGKQWAGNARTVENYRDIEVQN